MSENQMATGFGRASLAALDAGEICAIAIDDLIAPELCPQVADTVRQLTAASAYRWSDDLSIVGVSIGEAHECDETRERYFAQAERTNRLIREDIFGGVSPIDRMTLRLLDFWAPGIRTAWQDGRPFLQQVLRRWKQGGGAHPHIDQSRTPLLASLGIRRRYGLNLYVEMPSAGGAVEFWRRRFDEDEYAALRLPAPGYGLSRALVGEADLKLRPCAGRALLFDASRPHAVEAVAGTGERITCATFYAWGGDDRPLCQFA